MLKRVIAASVLALGAIGVAGGAQAHTDVDNECATANGIGVFIGGVTNPEATCHGNDFTSAEHPEGGQHAHCTIYVLVLANCE